MLSNQQLIQAYNQAKKLNLDERFIDMLKKEIEARHLLNEAEPSDV
nr:sporulation histidine kinase inhibitor Sda [Domibacillus robiginosus]